MNSVKKGVFLLLFYAGVVFSESAPLFVIQRSLNSNEVHYELNHSEGKILLSDPLKIYWVLNEKGGRHEPLTALEKRKAYGFKTETISESSFEFSLVAMPKEKIKVTKVGSEYVAQLPINGRAARLESVFIRLRPGGPIPKILEIILKGTDLQTGEKISDSRKRF